jgi:hypothetical protein
MSQRQIWIELGPLGKLVQEFADERAADRVTYVAQALASPRQRRPRCAPRPRFDQRAQIIEQTRAGRGKAETGFPRASRSKLLQSIAFMILD